MRLIFVKQMIDIIQKPPARLIVVGLLVLPLVLLSNSASGASANCETAIKQGAQSCAALQISGRLKSEMDLASGRFLVASDRLGDPNFRQTVVLLMRYGQQGAAGVVINRPLKVKLAEVLPDFKDSRHRDKLLYLGGPVEPTKILLLLKSAEPPPDAVPVFGDVYISSSPDVLQMLLKNSDKADEFKIFAGYAGWAPGQLEAETDREDWYVLKADAATVFQKKSSEIWPELIHRFRANWVDLKPEGGSGVQSQSFPPASQRVSMKAKLHLAQHAAGN